MSETLLTITGIAPSGAGIAEHLGFRVFVPGAVPGDVVLAEVEPPRRGVRSAVAQQVRIQQLSPDRDPSPCRALLCKPACGGCPLGRLSYPRQIKLKEALLLNALEAAGVDFPTPEPLLAALPEERSGFRNKAILYPERRNGHWLFGMFAQGSHKLVEEAGKCPQTPRWMADCALRLAKALDSTTLSPYDERTGTGDIRAILMREGRSKKTESLLTIVVRELTDDVRIELAGLVSQLSGLYLTGICVNIQPDPGNTVLGRQTLLIGGRSYVTAEIGSLSFSVRSETFLQVNTPQTARLYEKALSWADIKPEETFLDLYCGVGTMTLLGAVKAKEAVGVDIVEASIERARQNAETNGIANARFWAGPVETVLPTLVRDGLTPDTAIADPAFKGMENSVPDLLSRLTLKRLVYVSCSPVSFARDAKRLIALGWKLDKLGTVDLFPGALHVETVARFVR